MTGVPILMYHQVAPDTAPAFRKYCVTPAAFRSQIRWLSRTGYSAIDLDTLLEARAGLAALPPRPVVITFDDGFQDCVDYAVPVLLEYGMTAIMYLVTGLVGHVSTWLQAERGVQFPLMDWATARRLEAAGFRCESHAVSHPRLPELGIEACRRELADSRTALEEQLSRPITHLAYPFGSVDDQVRLVAAECGYRSACTTRIGLSPAGDDPLALQRVPITGSDSLLDFAVRLRTAHTPAELVTGKVAAAAALLSWRAQ